MKQFNTRGHQPADGGPAPSNPPNGGSSGIVLFGLKRRPADEVEAAIREGAERHGIDADLAVSIHKRQVAERDCRAGKTIARLASEVPARKVMPVAGPRAVPGDGGEARLMAVADGYVMARRPGKMPFVLTLHDWLALDDVKA